MKDKKNNSVFYSDILASINIILIVILLILAVIFYYI